MAKDDDATSASYDDWRFGRKKRRTMVDSKLTSRSLEETWLQEQERERKRLEGLASQPKSDPEEW